MAGKEAGADLPVVLVKWYDYTKWLMDRIAREPSRQTAALHIPFVCLTPRPA